MQNRKSGESTVKISHSLGGFFSHHLEAMLHEGQQVLQEEIIFSHL